jgi:hypothetical protein
LEVAQGYVTEYLQTLQFANQRLVYKDAAFRFLELYATYYRESKNIVKAEKECPRTSTAHCGCFFNFQPMERAKEDVAYKLLASEADILISTTLSSLGALYIKGLKINNGYRKQELLEILSKSLAQFASLVLIELGVENEYSPHDLVADLLLQYHTEILERRSVNINHLAQIYRRVNDCGRTPESFRELYKLRFPPDAEKKSDENEAQSKPSAKAPAPSIASSVSPAGTALSLNTPSVARNLSTALASASTSTGIAGTSFINAAQLAALNALVASLGGATPATIDATATTAPTPASPASLVFPPYPGAQPYYNKPTDAEDAELVEVLDRAMSEEERKAKEKESAEALAAARLNECKSTVCIDSIRPKSTLGLPPTPPTAPPDTGIPPLFPQPQNTAASFTDQNSNNTTTSSTDQSSTTATAASTVPTPSNPPVRVDTTTANTAPTVVTQPAAFDSSLAIANLWKSVKVCFIDAPSYYVNKYVHNETALKMAAFTSETQLEEHADKTSEVIALEGGPAGKIAKFVDGAEKYKEKVTRKRKSDTEMNDVKMSVEELRTEASRMKVLFEQEKKKRIKIESKLNAIKSTNNPTNSPNKSGGPATGANKNNQSGIPSATKKNQTNHNRGKKGHHAAAAANNGEDNERSKQNNERSRKYFQKKKHKIWRRQDQK